MHQAYVHQAHGRKYSVIKSRPNHSKLAGALDGLVQYLPVTSLKPLGHEDEQGTEEKDRVLWVKFEEHLDGESVTSLLLVGYSNGLQVWDVSTPSNMRETLSVRGFPVQHAKLLPQSATMHGEEEQLRQSAAAGGSAAREVLMLDQARPLIAIVPQPHVRVAAPMPHRSFDVRICSMNPSCRKVVKTLHFSSEVFGVECGLCAFVVALSEQLHVCHPRSLEPLFQLSCYPQPGSQILIDEDEDESNRDASSHSSEVRMKHPKLAPTHKCVMALGSSWLAYPYAPTVTSAGMARNPRDELRWPGQSQGVELGELRQVQELAGQQAARDGMRAQRELLGKGKGKREQNIEGQGASYTEVVQDVASLTAAGVSYGAQFLGKWGKKALDAGLQLTQQQQEPGGGGNTRKPRAASWGDSTSASSQQARRKRTRRHRLERHAGEVIVISLDVVMQHSLVGNKCSHSQSESGSSSTTSSQLGVLKSMWTPRVVCHFQPDRAVAAGSITSALSAVRTRASQALSAMAFSPSGLLLASATQNGQSIHIHRISPPQAVAPAKTTVTASKDGDVGNQSEAACIISPSSTTSKAEATAASHLYHISLAYRLVRGITHADVLHLRFSECGDWLAVGTAKGTSHLYAIDPHGNAPRLVNVTTCDDASGVGGAAAAAGLHTGQESRSASTSEQKNSSVEDASKDTGGVVSGEELQIAGTGLVHAQSETEYMTPLLEKRGLCGASNRRPLLLRAAGRVRQPWGALPNVEETSSPQKKSESESVCVSVSSSNPFGNGAQQPPQPPMANAGQTDASQSDMQISISSSPWQDLSSLSTLFIMAPHPDDDGKHNGGSNASKQHKESSAKSVTRDLKTNTGRRLARLHRYLLVAAQPGVLSHYLIEPTQVAPSKLVPHVMQQKHQHQHQHQQVESEIVSVQQFGQQGGVEQKGVSVVGGVSSGVGDAVAKIGQNIGKGIGIGMANISGSLGLSGVAGACTDMGGTDVMEPVQLTLRAIRHYDIRRLAQPAVPTDAFFMPKDEGDTFKRLVRSPTAAQTTTVIAAATATTQSDTSSAGMFTAQLPAFNLTPPVPMSTNPDSDCNSAVTGVRNPTTKADLWEDAACSDATENSSSSTGKKKKKKKKKASNTSNGDSKLAGLSTTDGHTTDPGSRTANSTNSPFGGGLPLAPTTPTAVRAGTRANVGVGVAQRATAYANGTSVEDSTLSQHWHGSRNSAQRLGSELTADRVLMASWLSEVELNTHAAPLVPLWAQPQVTFQRAGAGIDTGASTGRNGAPIWNWSDDVTPESEEMARGGTSQSLDRSGHRKKKKKGSASARAGCEAAGDIGAAGPVRQVPLTGDPLSMRLRLPLFVELVPTTTLCVRREGPVPMRATQMPLADNSQSSEEMLRRTTTFSDSITSGGTQSHRSSSNAPALLGQGASPVFDGKSTAGAVVVIPPLELTQGINSAIRTRLHFTPGKEPERKASGGMGSIGTGIGILSTARQDQHTHAADAVANASLGCFGTSDGSTAPERFPLVLSVEDGYFQRPPVPDPMIDVDDWEQIDVSGDGDNGTKRHVGSPTREFQMPESTRAVDLSSSQIETQGDDSLASPICPQLPVQLLQDPQHQQSLTSEQEEPAMARTKDVEKVKTATTSTSKKKKKRGKGKGRLS